MSNENIEKTKVLLGATGSVASIKIPDIISGMNIKFNGNVEIRFVPTQNALHFLPQVDEIEDKLGAKIYRDKDEWSSWSKRGDPVLHIELRKWADVLILAPLDANTLAKLSNGICDNLLTSVCRAWDFEKPIIFAPAMNTFMWEHPITSTQVNTLKTWGYHEIPPIEKVLMCKDVGKGAMAEPDTIVNVVCDSLKK